MRDQDGQYLDGAVFAFQGNHVKMLDNDGNLVSASAVTDLYGRTVFEVLVIDPRGNTSLSVRIYWCASPAMGRRPWTLWKLIMIADHRGVIDMLVKLAVCFLGIGLMVSLVVGTVSDSEDRFFVQALRSEAVYLRDDIQAAYCRNIIIHRCNLPAGQTLLVRGEGKDAYTIRLCVDGEVVETPHITSPTAYVDGPVTELSSDAVVVLDSRASDGTSWGGSGVRVTVL